MSASFIDYPNGVTTIDAEFIFPGIVSIHLIEQQGLAAFVDTGTTHSLPVVLETLRAKDISVDRVAYVIVTHVHLDHAGGAGAMMQAFPNARLIVHPLGARHMIDPSKLVSGTIAVYGEKKAHELYGEIVPVSESRVIIADDGFVLDFSGRILKFFDSPGHARHHFSIFDEHYGNLFTGDTLGISYRAFDSEQGPFLFPTTSPVQFDPDTLHRSIDRLMTLEPQALFLTHFGQITPAEKLIQSLHRRLDATVELALEAEHEDNREARIMQLIHEYYFQEAKEHGSSLTDQEIRAHLAMDAKINAQGLDIWLDRRQRH